MTDTLTLVRRSASPIGCHSAGRRGDRRNLHFRHRCLEKSFVILSATKHLQLLLALLLALAAPIAAQAQTTMPFNRYLASLRTGGDARANAFARNCIGAAYPKAKREVLYTEGEAWIKTPDLLAALGGYDTGDANTAEVWLVNGTPRAVYLWEVDLEYQRDSLFCIAPNGDEITHALSRFFPSASGEPREHWIYIHSVKPGPHVNVWVSTDYYEDKAGKRLDHPELSAEDKDFIAGERPYKYWNDFDFAEQIAPDNTQPRTDTLSSRPKARQSRDEVEGPVPSQPGANR